MEPLGALMLCCAGTRKACQVLTLTTFMWRLTHPTHLILPPQRPELRAGHTEAASAQERQCTAVRTDGASPSELAAGLSIARSGTADGLGHARPPSIPQLADSLINNCKIELHREISSRAFTQTLTRLVQDRVGSRAFRPLEMPRDRLTSHPVAHCRPRTTR